MRPSTVLPRLRAAAAALGWWLGAACAASASLSGAELCERASQQAAAEVGVPADILGALTLTETGRRHNGVVRPWAWSVNAAGAGSWFDAPQAALAFAGQRVAAGRTNVDIGCFQLNYHWHGRNFPSLEAMFDPLTNARYAARFVAQLHAETGDWRAAAGAFHSRRPQDSQRYLQRFDELRAALQGRGFDSLEASPETYNSFADASGGGAEAGWPDGDPLPLDATAQPPERLTLLGLPLDTPRTGTAGSLAVIGGAREPLLSGGSLLVAAAAGPLVTLGAAAPP